MAIHAKVTGLLIAGEVIDETESRWIFQAMDNKQPTVVSKTDEKASIFDGENAVYDAMDWQNAQRKKLGMKPW